MSDEVKHGPVAGYNSDGKILHPDWVSDEELDLFADWKPGKSITIDTNSIGFLIQEVAAHRSRLSREESATQPTESAAAIVKALRKAVKAIEELYSTERGVYQHSEECRAVHAFLSEARSALAHYSAPKGGN